MERDTDGPSERTLCEINCQLVSTSAVKLGRLGGHACPDIYLSSSDQAAFLDGHVPTVLVKVPPGHLPRGEVRSIDRKEHEGVMKYVLRTLLHPLPWIRSRFQAATGLQLLSAPAGAPLAWHPRRPLLAAADGADRVHIYDFGGHVPTLGQGSSVPTAPLAPSQLLYHEFQRGVAALAWRPNAGACVAAACARGVCVWHASGKGPLGACGRGEGAAGRAAAGSNAAGGGAWMSWLRPPPGTGPLTCLAWHPRGHLLVAASQQGSGFCIWDAATGACTPLRAGTEPVSLLSWSPCGSYLLTAHPSGSFRVWQTHTWWPLKWSAAESGGAARDGAGAAAGGGLAGAAWSPDSRTLVLAYRSAPQQLVSLCFTSDPPSLEAQLLPLSLTEAASGANGGRSSGGGVVVEGVAWDARGQRLAVAVCGSHPAAGSVALYDTRCDPILTARFIGWCTITPMAAAVGEAGQHGQHGRGRRSGHGQAAAAAACSEIEEVAEGGQEPGRAGADGGRRQAGAAAEAGSIQLCFQPSFGQGALLAVRRGDFIGTVPLYFSS